VKNLLTNGAAWSSQKFPTKKQWFMGIPSSETPASKHQTSPPSVFQEGNTKNIRQLKQRVRSLHAKHKVIKLPRHYEAYREAQKLLNNIKKDAESTFLSSTMDNMLKSAQKRFWTYVKYKTKGQHCSIPTLKTRSGGNVTDATNKANLLNEHFKSVFSPDVPIQDFEIPVKTNQKFSLTNITLTKAGIVNLVKNLNPHKSPGPDKISSKLLKLAPEELSDYLLILFNKGLKLQQIPAIWKTANITPIFKKGNRSDPVNYRPISLTSVLCKMFEHIITSNLAKFLEDNHLFNKDQFGFRKHLSCELQLQRVCQDIAFILDNNEEADLIFLDFSKAFDKVPHHLLLQKLKSYGIQDDIVNIVTSFLTGRTQKVVLDGYSSNPVAVSSGVPQGSVLGPLLFLLYINDLPDNIRSKCRLFADDSLIFRKISTKADYLALQNDLDEVIYWCNKWHMTLNLEKCEIMHVTSKRNPVINKYSLANHPLTLTSSYKYLGLYMENNLSWNHHINHIINKANKVLYITRQALSKCSTTVKTTAYNSIIRPLLEYSSSVWDPYQTGQINAIEMVQRKAARFCLNRYKKVDSVSTMLQELNWKPLTLRRKATRLSIFSKVYNNMDSLQDLSSYIQKAPCEKLRNAHPFRVQSINCHKNIGHYSFLPRTIREWNALPSNILSEENIIN